MRLLHTALCLAFVYLVPAIPSLWADEKPNNFAKWEGEITAFEKADQTSPPPKHAIVFVGSSSIRLWKTLAQDFPRHQVINRGFGGSEILDSVYFADRIVIPYEPRMVVLYAGGNDINAGKSPEQVFANFQDFEEKVHGKLPEVDLAYISSAGNPRRWAQVEKVKALNAKIAAYMEGKPHLKFIDVFSKMLGADGLPRPEIFGPDGLHMNSEGYKLWTAIVGPLLPPPDRE